MTARRWRCARSAPITTSTTAPRRWAFCSGTRPKGQIVTGVLFIADEPQDLHASLKTVKQPLNTLGEKELCPGSAALDKINAGLR